MSSYRSATGLQTEVTVPEKYQAREARPPAVVESARSHGRSRARRGKPCAQELPGVVSPGILCTLMTCHGNWAVRRASRRCFMRTPPASPPHARARPRRAQSSLALMDKAILPRPPLMARRAAAQVAPRVRL